jgi:hypothetical protein
MARHVSRVGQGNVAARRNATHCGPSRVWFGSPKKLARRAAEPSTRDARAPRQCSMNFATRLASLSKWVPAQ